MIGSSRKAKPRRFSYEPRFYDPTRDDRLKHRMRIKSRARHRRSPLALLYFFALLSFAIFIYGALG